MDCDFSPSSPHLLPNGLFSPQNQISFELLALSGLSGFSTFKGGKMLIFQGFANSRIVREFPPFSFKVRIATLTRNQFEGNLTRVRIPPAAPKREAKKDIEDKTSVFSRLPRPVDQQIYGPYFSDILPCAIHSGRSRTHTIFTLSGISFEAGILLLQDLGLFYSAVETDSPNRKQKNVRLLYGATIF